jgi:hypothetical protein
MEAQFPKTSCLDLSLQCIFSKKSKKPHTYETILFMASMMIHGGIYKENLIKIMRKFLNDIKYMHHIIK